MTRRREDGNTAVTMTDAPVPITSTAALATLIADVSGLDGNNVGVIKSDDLEELSELDVQRLLEQQECEEATEPDPTPPPPAVAQAFPSEPHLLDSAPVNSKVVVTEDGAMLATPNGVQPIAKSDIASRLPRGARIQKVGDGVFRATQLDAGYPVTPKDYANASAAILDFAAEFHQRQSAGNQG